MNQSQIADQLNRANIQPGSAKPVPFARGAIARSGQEQSLNDQGSSPPSPGDQGSSGNPGLSQKPLPPLISQPGNPNPPNYDPDADEG